MKYIPMSTLTEQAVRQYNEGDDAYMEVSIQCEALTNADKAIQALGKLEQLSIDLEAALSDDYAFREALDGVQGALSVQMDDLRRELVIATKWLVASMMPA